MKVGKCLPLLKVLIAACPAMAVAAACVSPLVRGGLAANEALLIEGQAFPTVSHPASSSQFRVSGKGNPAATRKQERIFWDYFVLGLVNFKKKPKS